MAMSINGIKIHLSNLLRHNIIFGSIPWLTLGYLSGLVKPTGILFVSRIEEEDGPFPEITHLKFGGRALVRLNLHQHNIDFC